MKIGLVGKPNAGKSTFFKAATLIDVSIGDYPFTTIDANKGYGFVRVECPEKFFNVRCNPRQGFCIHGNRFVPVELVDVAGLVPEAHLGRGMGNKFLDDLRQADALIHIVDASGKTDLNGRKCEEHNPIEDIKFLEEELNHWYLNILDRNWKKMRDIKDIAKQFSGLKIKEEDIRKVIKDLSISEDIYKWDAEEKKMFVKKLRENAQPMIIAANKIDITDKYFEELKKFNAIPVSADIELALRNASKNKLIDYIPGDNNFKIIGKINDKQKDALKKIEDFLNKYKSTGVQEIINKVVFELLKYIVVFPGGVKKLSDKEGRVLPDAFLMPPNSTALDFAYKIHEEFGKKFIAAINVKTKQRVGKDYKLKNGDVIEIISGR
ncbi:MAG: hypothetical protein B6U88_01150 [Candidatus Aenigmarchaeota archaeon ex4484_56]|nr:MAG: hypothetical protein B6U88_01150 [Candidatus Aenigmarchaeota archaeon ex4484_56]